MGQIITNTLDTSAWPALHLADWKDTCNTLHMWTQVIGKIRLALTPPVNHWWHCTLYVSCRGLTTSSIPYRGKAFEMEFDFIDHRLVIRVSDGSATAIPLYGRPVAEFYAEVMAKLSALGIEVKIWSMPVEVPNPIAFEKDTVHASYDSEYVRRFWDVLLHVNAVFEEFRGKFLGKSSPVQFFWGSFDLAVTRFSGRRAPERPNADRITREAYSHEVISAGFWPGSGEISDASFYAYAAPEPPGLFASQIQPAMAYYNHNLGEFLLSYETVRKAQSPRKMLMDFLQSTYDAAATLARWERDELELSKAA